MRKVLILFVALFLVSLSSTFAQTLMDYVKEVKGDTLVVNDYTDMGQQPSSIVNVVVSDTVNVPAGRVYQLQTNGWYPMGAGLTTPSNRPVIIAGADNTPLVNNSNAGAAPPIISGFNAVSGTQIGGFTYQNDFTLKNVSIICGAPDGTYGWAYISPGAPNLRGVFENCMMEHNWWVFIQSNAWAGSRLYFKDDYLVNMSGYTCRRNGGVYDNVNNPTDTMWVENCTNIMGSGSMYKFRNYEVKLIFFNHNTFINCAGSMFETQGFQSNMAVTNNIFVNCNEQPFRPNMTEDLSEQDALGTATGLIDICPLPDTLTPLPRKFLVQNNVVYWDPKLIDLATEANSMAINTFTTWVNQSVTMNTRTQGYFDDNANYPFLTVAHWYNQLPTFNNTSTLLTDQVDSLHNFCLATVDTTSTKVLSDWRVTSTDFLYSDWPVPVNLSYTDANLLTGGTDGLPVGDLNWFPSQKANHTAGMDDAILNALFLGDTVTTGVQVVGGTIPTKYSLTQNYPNPFNPTTNINFTLPKAGNVTLKVYDIMGREIATLVNGYQAAQTYHVQFDGSSLASGVYFYTLHTDNFTQTKKMILMK
jgi:hypothetical protein